MMILQLKTGMSKLVMNLSKTIGFYDGIYFKLDLLINSNNTLKETVEKVISGKQIR